MYTGENKVFTIGYRSLNRAAILLDKMNRLGITKLFDIRSKPGASGKFGKITISAILKDRYVSNPVLGGFDHDRTQYDAWKFRAKEGLDDIVAELENGNVMIMCAEIRPATCHRSYFMEPALLELGVEVKHL